MVGYGAFVAGTTPSAPVGTLSFAEFGVVVGSPVLLVSGVSKLPFGMFEFGPSGCWGLTPGITGGLDGLPRFVTGLVPGLFPGLRSGLLSGLLQKNVIDTPRPSTSVSPHPLG